MKIFLLMFALCCTLSQKVLSQNANTIMISGSGDRFKENDSVRVCMLKYNLSLVNETIAPNVKVPVKDGKFSVTFNSVERPTYFYISFPRATLYKAFAYYLISPGQHVTIDFLNDHVKIDGKAFRAQYLTRLADKETHFPSFNLKNVNPYIITLDSLSQTRLTDLKKFRADFTRDEWAILSTDEEAVMASIIYHDLRGNSSNKDTSGTNLIGQYQKFASPDRVINRNFDWRINYLRNCEYDLEKYKWDSCYVLKRSFALKDYLRHVLMTYSGLQRDKAIVYALFRHPSLTGDLRLELQKAIFESVTPDLKAIMEQFLSKKVDGASAYNFTLTGLDGKPVSLSDFRGSVVILDFWFTGCPGCRDLAPFMRKIEEQFKGKNVKFIGVSIDRDREKWKKSIQTGVYVSPEITNLITNGKGTDDKVVDEYKISAYPSLYLIDKNGKLINIKTDPRFDKGIALTNQISMLL